MDNTSDDDLLNLVANEQRAFRRILFTGVGMLALLVLMSLGLSVYYFIAVRDVQRNAREMREREFKIQDEVAQQRDTLANLFEQVRANYDEIHSIVLSTPGLANTNSVESAVGAVTAYLVDGTPVSLSDERAIRTSLSRQSPAPPAARELIAGAYSLLQAEQQGIRYNVAGEPPKAWTEAHAHFEKARSADAYALAARAGVAAVLYRLASSRALNYPADKCEELTKTVGEGIQLGIQPLLWVGQCQRKLGLTSAALQTYANATNARDPSPLKEEGSDEASANRMTAIHGLGTTLIAAHRLADGQPELQFAMRVAAQHCRPSGINPSHSDRMDLARACLRHVIDLRRSIGEDRSIPGTQENLGFAYLLDSSYADALNNAEAVAKVSPTLPWNQMVRYLAATELRDRQTRRDAIEKLSLIETPRFNLCELRNLLNDELFAKAWRAIAESHPASKPVECPPAAS